MGNSTNKQKIVEAISELTGVTPRQQINQEAALLESKGDIEQRKTGKKIASHWLEKSSPQDDIKNWR